MSMRYTLAGHGLFHDSAAFRQIMRDILVAAGRLNIEAKTSADHICAVRFNVAAYGPYAVARDFEDKLRLLQPHVRGETELQSQIGTEARTVTLIETQKTEPAARQSLRAQAAELAKKMTATERRALVRDIQLLEVEGSDHE